MEYFGVFAFILVLAYSSYPGKVKRLETKLRKMEKKQKGDPVMSKLINELIGKQCRIKPNEEIELVDSWIQCQVLDADDEWIKIRYEDKKKGVVTRLFRIENIDEVEVLG